MFEPRTADRANRVDVRIEFLSDFYQAKKISKFLGPDARQNDFVPGISGFDPVFEKNSRDNLTWMIWKTHNGDMIKSPFKIWWFHFCFSVRSLSLFIFPLTVINSSSCEHYCEIKINTYQCMSHVQECRIQMLYNELQYSVVSRQRRWRGGREAVIQSFRGCWLEH